LPGLTSTTAAAAYQAEPAAAAVPYTPPAPSTACPPATAGRALVPQRASVAKAARSSATKPTPSPAAAPSSTATTSTSPEDVAASSRAAATAASLSRALPVRPARSFGRGGSTSTRDTPQPHSTPVPSTGGQAPPEGVRHQHQAGVLADRAVLARRLAQVAGGPEQLGMGVAHVGARQPALLER